MKPCPDRIGCEEAVPLSPREREVLRLLAQGKKRGEVAAATCSQVRTVDQWVCILRQKLDLASVNELIVWAVKHDF